MKVSVSLFGAFSAFGSANGERPRIELELGEGGRIADLRVALHAHLSEHWRDFRPQLLRYSAFADSTQVLRDGDPLPADGEVAVLPPVSGG